MRSNLLLLSNGRMPGQAYLAHALDALAEWLDGVRVVHFIPYASRGYDDYTAATAAALAPLSVRVVGLHTEPDPRAALAAAAALLVGGGNSFRLIRTLHDLHLVETVRDRVVRGELRYGGASAGANMACPTIRTTNDMPIVQPPSFDALGLIPFQINPHFVSADPTSTHMGETREQRLHEFLDENDVPVIGLREGSWLRRRDGELRLDGMAGAVLFQRGAEPEVYETGADLSFLLDTTPRYDTAIAL